MVEWKRHDEASIYRPAKEFADDRKHVRKWCQRYSTLKAGKRRRLCCGQPLLVDLDHRVSGGREKRRQIGVKPVSIGL